MKGVLSEAFPDRDAAGFIFYPLLDFTCRFNAFAAVKSDYPPIRSAVLVIERDLDHLIWRARTDLCRDTRLIEAKALLDLW